MAGVFLINKYHLLAGAFVNIQGDVSEAVRVVSGDPSGTALGALGGCGSREAPWLRVAVRMSAG